MGQQLGLFDIPNERSSHRNPTPKGGGIGLLAGFLFSSFLMGISHWFWIPAASVSLLGLFSDRFEISPRYRLLVQFIAAIALINFNHQFSQPNIPAFSWNFSIPLLLLLSLFIVGTTNFYNFMDGINGIAGITGIIGFGLIAFYAYQPGYNVSLGTVAVCISFACMGFLPFNMPKARVFMGDVGSILLGFVFAGMVVYLSKNLVDFICLSAFLFPFYLDELNTMIVRLRDGENLTKAHRRHLYQLLANEYGIAHWKVSLGYGMFQLCVGISILFIKTDSNMAVISVLVLYFCLFNVLSSILRKRIK
jgi:Fuc2NAc and GlcNAc transferase